MIAIQKDWKILEKKYMRHRIDIFHIYLKIKEFYRLVEYDDEEEMDSLVRISHARRLLESAIILLRNIIGASNNKYIEPQKEIYDWFLDNLGRVEKRIEDEDITSIREIFDANEVYNKKIKLNIKIPFYISYLHELIENLVYFPLRSGYINFVNLNLQNKDGELLLYKVYEEMCYSAEYLGALTAEQVKSVPKNIGVQSTYPTRSKRIPPIPPNFEDVPKTYSESLNPNEGYVENVENYAYKDKEIFGGEDESEKNF